MVQPVLVVRLVQLDLQAQPVRRVLQEPLVLLLQSLDLRVRQAIQVRPDQQVLQEQQALQVLPVL